MVGVVGSSPIAPTILLYREPSTLSGVFSLWRRVRDCRLWRDCDHPICPLPGHPWPGVHGAAKCHWHFGRHAPFASAQGSLRPLDSASCGIVESNCAAFLWLLVFLLSTAVRHYPLLDRSNLCSNLDVGLLLATGVTAVLTDAKIKAAKPILRRAAPIDWRYHERRRSRSCGF